MTIIYCTSAITAKPSEDSPCIDLFFFQAEDGIRVLYVTGVQTCALPISSCGAVPILKPPTAMVVAWQLLQPPLPSAMWLAAPEVPTVPGGTTTDTPYHAMAALWQLWQLSALTAVWPVEDSNAVLVSLKPVPLSVSLTAWQPEQSALLTGM